jgi:hypothetical protein
MATNHGTDADPKMRGCLQAKRSERLRIDQTVASTGSSCVERKTQSPVQALEIDGHLQFCIRDVLPFIGYGMRGPQGLWYHGSLGHEATIKDPIGLGGILDREMLRDRRGEEERAFSPLVIRGGM